MVTSQNIAIVDDDDGVREALSGLMRSLGYSVQCFRSALDFLARAKTRDPDFLISDVRMPGMSGEELIVELRETGRQMPVVLMTAFATPALRERLMAAGALALIDKPVDGQVLAEILDGALREHT